MHGISSEQELKSIEAEIDTLEQSLRSGKEEAAADCEYYNTIVLACTNNRARIMELSTEPTSDTLSQVATAQHTFTLVLSADYQQSILIPHSFRTARLHLLSSKAILLYHSTFSVLWITEMTRKPSSYSMNVSGLRKHGSYYSQTWLVSTLKGKPKKYLLSKVLTKQTSLIFVE